MRVQFPEGEISRLQTSSPGTILAPCGAEAVLVVFPDELPGLAAGDRGHPQLTNLVLEETEEATLSPSGEKAGGLETDSWLLGDSSSRVRRELLRMTFDLIGSPHARKGKETRMKLNVKALALTSGHSLWRSGVCSSPRCG